MKKAIAIIAGIALLVTFALGVAPTTAVSMTSVIADFESNIDGVTITEGWGHPSITASHNTTDPLIGTGSCTVTLTGYNGVWQQVNYPIVGTEAANWDGIVVRINASFAATRQLALDLQPGGHSALKFIDLYGKDVTEDWTTTNFYGDMAQTPAGFNGWLFSSFSGDVSAVTSLGLTFGDYGNALADNIIEIDQFAYYDGTDYSGIVTELGAPFADYTSVIDDFEDGSTGWTAVTWDGGDYFAKSDASGADALIGNGSMVFTAGATGSLGNTWSGMSTPFNGAIAADYEGWCFRIDTRDMTVGNDNDIWLIAYLSKYGGMTKFNTDFKLFDLYGKDVTSTSSWHQNDIRIPAGFNGWLFMPFATNMTTAGGTVAEQTELILGLSDYYFGADVSGKKVVIDDVALYQTTDYAEIVAELGAQFVERTSVIADFESDVDDVTITEGWGHPSITASHNTTDPLIGDGSCTVTLTGYNGVWQQVNLPIVGTEAANWDGIAVRINASFAATRQLALDLQPGGHDALKFIDIYGNDVTEVWADTNFYGDMAQTPAGFNGWLFSSFSGDVSAVTSLGLTFGDYGNALADNIIEIDQFAYYSGSDYASIVEDLGAAFIPEPTPTPTETPTEAQPTTAPTDAPTATNNTPGGNDHTGDVSLAFFAIAAFASSAAGLLVSKKKK